ncbi:hypothetical protein D3C72_2015330 [compost metagenome]
MQLPALIKAIQPVKTQGEEGHYAKLQGRDYEEGKLLAPEFSQVVFVDTTHQKSLIANTKAHIQGQMAFDPQ